MVGRLLQTGKCTHVPAVVLEKVFIEKIIGMQYKLTGY